VRATRESERFVCGLRTDLHFADVLFLLGYMIKRVAELQVQDSGCGEVGGGRWRAVADSRFK